MAKTVKVQEICEALDLKVLYGDEFLDREVTTPFLSRPSAELAGYFEFYDETRIKIFGNKEMYILDHLDEETQITNLDRIITKETPCIVVARDYNVNEVLLEEAKKDEVPVLVSSEATTTVYSRLYNFLEDSFAPTESVHGVLMEIFGVGVLIKGDSGIGKSEAALELLQKKHILIADDRVDITKNGSGVLIGKAPAILKNMMEIRGVGIIDVMKIFGAGSVRIQKKVDMIIYLQEWVTGLEYDRLGLEKNYTKILDTDVETIIIPVHAGRNNASLVEVAALNFRLKYLGYDAAQEFVNRLDETLLNKKNNNLN